jgi:hypothetical protein
MHVSRILPASVLSLLFLPACAFAQQPVLLASADTAVESSSVLPDAPSSTLRTSPDAADFAPMSGGQAPKYSLVIEPGQTAQHLSGGDKVVLGIRSIATVPTLAGALLSSGYSHLTDGQPNYGVDREAFAKRFGASMARGASQDIFTTSILSPVMHMDTRYYVLGDGHNVAKRAVYAATRVLVGKTDGGRNTVNAPLLIGYAGAAALTNVYYPQINRNFKDTASSYGGSLGGAALGFVFNEFEGDILRALHMKKN